MIGQTISHYKILEKLGEGGMGIVYKAEDTTLKRTVALKFLPPKLTRDPEAKERFIQEARAASALEHPNICNIHEIGETEPAPAEAGGQLFIVMAYYEGQTVKEKIRNIPLNPPSKGDSTPIPPLRGDTGGCIPLASAIDIAIQICEGLAAAHEKGIVHRDIKSDNIIVTPKGQIKIMDFGLAKLRGVSYLTREGTTLGTVPYMSPEQVQGIEVDHRSDVFSLGVVLYEMITGQLPFKGEHEPAVIYSIMNETPEPLARYKADVPEGLQHVVDRALAKERNERYQHVDEMVVDLRAVEMKPRPEMKTQKRSKLPLYIASGVVFLLLIVIGDLFLLPKPTPVSEKSIAVLPFKNLSDSKEDEYFADGLTEDIITQLSKIRGIEKVIARTSVMRYKDSDKSVHDIGEELNVATLLEGSVRRAGNQIRVVAQLIDVRTEGHLWADTYDKEMTQVFAIQSEVAQRIAAGLKATLTPKEKEEISKEQTGNTAAYQLYLKGRFYWNKRRAEDLEKAMDYLHQAIDKDPNYALAYAGLASTYVVYPEYSGRPAGEYLPKAKDAANKALKLDGTLAEAHAVLGLIRQQYEYDWEGAEREYKRAIELNPNYPTAYHWYRLCLTSQGRFDEALVEIERAQALDPLSMVINTNLALSYKYLRQYDRAIDQGKKILEFDPNFPLVRTILGFIYAEQVKYDDAIAEFQKVRVLAPNDPSGISGLGYTYARAGRKDDALQMLDRLIELSKQNYSMAVQIAQIFAGLGEKDTAFEWLNRGHDERNRWMEDLKVSFVWENLRSDPRYHELLKKIGLEK